MRRIQVYRALALMVVAAALFCLTMFRPAWNFDTLGYAAVARSWIGQSPQDVHAGVFTDLRQFAPEKRIRELTESSAYRARLAREPEQLDMQIPFYTNKPLYVAAVAALHGLGVNSVRATFLVSAAAYAALAVLFIVWLATASSPVVAWTIGLCLMLAPPIRELGELATPDALATLCATTALFAMARGRRALGMAAWVAAIAARPDSVFLSLGVLGWRAWAGADRRKPSLACASIVVLASALTMHLTESYSWSVIFRHTFVERVVDPSGFVGAAALFPLPYVEALGRGLLGEYVLHPSILLIFAGWAAITYFHARHGREPGSRAQVGLLAFVGASALLHFLAFPMLADRFFVAHYLCIASCSVSVSCGSRARSDAGVSSRPPGRLQLDPRGADGAT